MMKAEEPVAKRVKLGNDSNADVNSQHSEENGMKESVLSNISTSLTETAASSENGIGIPAHCCEAELKAGMYNLLNEQRFSGIIKQRYSDFMVRECDKDGKLVYLTSLDHIDKENNITNNKSEEKKDESIPPCPISDVEELTKIEEFASSEDKSKKMTLTVDDDKEHRKLVHVYIKVKYKNIETDTVTLDDGSRAIEISFKSNRQGKNRRSDNPKRNIPKCCNFVLFKQNKDTMECISLLAKMLRINPGNFAYAGTKDKRATTIQNISVHNTLSQRLQGLNRNLRNITLGNFSYVDSGLSLGDLTGNEFTIVIRDVVEDSDGDIERACTSLRDKGFINFFGLQRFGTGAIPTHDVGKALLSSKFGEACDMILKPRNESDQNNPQNEVKAQKVWMETKDPKKAFAEIRQKYSIEGKLLDGLCKRGSNNFLEAFRSIPRNTRLLYLHSYQSLVWNKAVSKRIEEYGLNPAVGDLVLKEEKDENGYQQIHVLAQEDIECGTYTIYDIVLPLPGYDMKYPSNKICEYYKELLASDGLDLHDMRRPQKELSLSGKYRNIVTKPKNMSWKCVRYDDYTLPLIENDFERLQSSKSNGGDDDDNKSVSKTPTTACTDGVENGKHKALRLQMTLPSSCYATTALRELLTSDSSYKAQLELNKNFSVK